MICAMKAFSRVSVEYLACCSSCFSPLCQIVWRLPTFYDLCTNLDAMLSSSRVTSWPPHIARVYTLPATFILINRVGRILHKSRWWPGEIVCRPSGSLMAEGNSWWRLWVAGGPALVLQL